MLYARSLRFLFSVIFYVVSCVGGPHYDIGVKKDYISIFFKLCEFNHSTTDEDRMQNEDEDYATTSYQMVD